MKYDIELSEYARTNNYFVGIKELKPGINIHAIGNLRLAEYFDLRALPGISFGARQLYFIGRSGSGEDSLLYNQEPYQAQSSYLELPLSIKYKAHRINNFRPYLIGGANIRYDLAVKKEYNFKEQLIMIKSLDYYAEFGVGFDFYLEFFKFSIETKYSVGMTNIFREETRSGKKPENFPEYTNMLKSLKSNVFIISFHFE